jgi:hypothetical protein
MNIRQSQWWAMPTLRDDGRHREIADIGKHYRSIFTAVASPGAAAKDGIQKKNH